MDAHKRSVFEIFTGNRVLEIPFFQRDYVWDEPEWERLLEDVTEASVIGMPYFLGPVILKQESTPTDGRVGDVRTVIDGQQRLMTLNILFKVLCQKNEEMHRYNKRFRLDDDNPVLKPSQKDEISFGNIMKAGSGEYVEGTDRISRAYRYFDDKIEPSKVDFTVGDWLHFVLIDLLADDDEQQIFDTINSLGVRLTTAELLKNYFFRRDELASYESYWKDVFEKDDEARKYWDREITTGNMKRSLIDLFFFSFLQIKIQDRSLGVSAIDKQAFSKVEKLFDSYKRFIKNYLGDNKEGILKEIHQYANTFFNSINPDIVDESLSAEAGIERLNAIIFGLDTTTLIPYVLFVEQNVPDVSVKNELYRYLEAYIMRRIIARASTKAYNQLFTDRLILRRILTNGELKEQLTAREEPVYRMPSDEHVYRAFEEEILTNKNARGVLYMIETKIRDPKRHSTQLLGLSKYSLEHIMPKKWYNNWTNPKEPFSKEDRDRLLLTLGNLTIITQALNASIRDANWTMKKKGANSKGGLKSYSQGIEILSSFLDENKWDEVQIVGRAQFLAEKAVEIWMP
ncbi:MAG: DUF262 domain-containing HNH endonuclease family protein [Saccharofermentanales bacterium]